MEARDLLNTNNPALYENDGLILPVVGSWALTKYRNIGTYCSIFSSGMRNKWDSLVYIDLFAGAGKSIIKNTETILPGSPLLALNARTPFNKYIFCERDPKNFDVLKIRVKRLFPERDCSFFCGDVNASIERLLEKVPKYSKHFRVLSFCFIDPFNTSQLKFETIRKISRIYVDFLILIPSYMDINRNIVSYIRKTDHSIDLFLGDQEWRVQWRKRALNPKMFGQFVVDLFCEKMRSIGYICESPDDLILIRFEENRNQPLYHLGLFSKNPRGLDFWRKSKDNISKQKTLDFKLDKN